MKYSVLRYMSYAVLGFGFLYMTWHLGRAFEGGDGREGDGDGVQGDGRRV